MKKRTLPLLPSLFLLASPLSAQNALQRSVHQMEYGVEAQVSTSKGDTPLWLTANRYGLSSVEKQNGYLRASIRRDASADSLYQWRIGYGVDVAAGYHYSSKAFVQQLYADIDYRLVRLTIGAKDQPMAMKNAMLSSGSQTLGINARAVPAVRFELPEYWNISGRADIAAIRGHISYGMLTDGNFQEDYIGSNTTAHYAKKVLLHTKAGYLRLGNAKKFPLVFEGGLEMATQFGGTSYNYLSWDGVSAEPLKMKSGLKDIIKATFGGGGDSTDSDGYANSTGNMLGSWLARLTWHGKDWSLGVYYDHFFEDHSQMFLQYGWLDGMVGIEAHLPKNRFVDNVVYEYVKTTYQSGPVYHDTTNEIPDQISGVDNYYNHNLYAGWQHWGQAMGNVFFTSPLYNHNADLTFASNRFKAHHIGISGKPSDVLQYRMLYSHLRSLGTYAVPYDRARTNHSFMLELAYNPTHLGKLATKGWGLKAAFAMDRGDLLNDNTGLQITISKTGLLTH